MCIRDRVGGGQTFYRSIIKKNPQIEFYYIAEKEALENSRPANATAIPYKDQFLISDFKNFFEVTPPKWVERAFAMASNIAASVANQNLYPWQAELLLFSEKDQRGPH